MAKRKRRCPFCERPFTNEQAIRAHLRFCRAYRLKKRRAAKAGSMPQADQPHGTTAVQTEEAKPCKPLARRHGGNSHECLLLLLDVYEVIPQLKRECSEYASISRLIASSPKGSHLTSEEDWMKLYEMLDSCERDYDQMVFGLRPDSVLLFSIYQRMLTIKGHWLCFRTNDLHPPHHEEMEENNVAVLREESLMWTRIMTSLKTMVVASR